MRARWRPDSGASGCVGGLVGMLLTVSSPGFRVEASRPLGVVLIRWGFAAEAGAAAAVVVEVFDPAGDPV